jgi:hypothetical protein
MTSPTQRTLARLKAEGMTAGSVEKFNRFGGPFGIRQDLFGFLDLIALDPKTLTTIGIQVTGQHGHADHRRKIIEDCGARAVLWLKCGNRLILWSWRKLKVKRGGKQRKWEPRIEELTLDSFTVKKGARK